MRLGKLISLLSLIIPFSLFAQVTQVKYLDYKKKLIAIESIVIDSVRNYENIVKLTKGKAHGLLRINSPRENISLNNDTLIEYYIYYRIEYNDIPSTKKGHRYNEDVNFKSLFSSGDSIVEFISSCLNKIDKKTFKKFLTDSYGSIPSTNPIFRITEINKIFWSHGFPIAMDILNSDNELCIRVHSKRDEDYYLYTGVFYEKNELKGISYIDSVYWNEIKDSVTIDRIYIRHPYEVTTT